MDLIFGTFNENSFYERDGSLVEEPVETLEELIRQYEQAMYRYEYIERQVNEMAAPHSCTRWINDFEPVFVEDTVRDYGHRTWLNAEWSDITLAIAVDLESPGEVTTRKAAGNKYVSCQLDPEALFKIGYYSRRWGHQMADSIADMIRRNPHFKEDGIRLNVAGNGLDTLEEHGIPYKKINAVVFELLLYVSQQIPILEIRTGGQTGVDEAAIKAAQLLSIKCSVLAPKGWRYRDKHGEDLDGKEGFIARFKEERIDYEKWEANHEDDDDMFFCGLAEFNSYGAIEMKEWEIDLKIMHLNARNIEKNN